MLKDRSASVVLSMLGALLLAPTFVFAGVQDTPDGVRTMVNSDVGNERWAITRHPDGSLTGNVFRQGGGDPAFIVCTPNEAPESYTCDGGDGCLTPAGTPGQSPRGTSKSPINDVLFASKDVGTERWAITLNEDDTLTGNVFRSDGGPPSFIYCEPEGNEFRCFGDEECGGEPCGQSYDEIGPVTLPSDFFELPDGCADSYTRIGDDVPLSDSFFEPGSSVDGCVVATLTLSAPSPLTAATVELDYPTDSVSIPGSIDAPSVQERVNFLVSGQLTIVNDTDTPPFEATDDQITLTVAGATTPFSGAFATVAFDCVGPQPSVEDFLCSATGSDEGSNAVEPSCSVSLAFQ